jgi:hypothetical protein
MKPTMKAKRRNATAAGHPISKGRDIPLRELDFGGVYRFSVTKSSQSAQPEIALNTTGATFTNGNRW